MIAPPAVMLSGGASRRMGGTDKALMPLAGEPLLAHVIARIAPQTERLALNTNSADPALGGFGLPMLPDTLPDRPGPLAGILAAMDWAAELGDTHVVTVPGDTPFLPADLIPCLTLRGAGDAPVVAASSGRLHPVAGLWPVASRTALRDAITGGLRKVTDWTDAAGALTCEFPATDPDLFFNVNTPEDLARAERLIGGTR
ncbi:molybdenum cofactor guanylyltransferase [Primorskyibacter flagellatus]|uniref:Molybdenum cofactor guanylyltransferase n=1 Tax=Primorskyibacter flagellatus TaxID=1387277 RepID=A0A917ABD0_9RHOB|nr:molybdenum cofactor guanylyltransferase MobA [Primorskyibacter flagellatus]GGE40979.1 molybdenum cofactor guanylyltransferase [Primorskyibacter flagellatus]